MRIVVLGATGNVGTSLLEQLSRDARADEVLAVARRLLRISLTKTRFVRADISEDPLEPLVDGADVVVHLAWRIEPQRDEASQRRTNVDGTRRLLDAIASRPVPALVYASSVETYSPGPKDRRVDASWPTEGIGTSVYSRHKAEVERMLDRFEHDHPTCASSACARGSSSSDRRRRRSGATYSAR